MPVPPVARFSAWAVVTLAAIGLGGRGGGKPGGGGGGLYSFLEDALRHSNKSSGLGDTNKGRWRGQGASPGGDGRLPDAVFATGSANAGPVVMDGRGTALPVVTSYPAAEPLSVSAWVLVYSPPFVESSSDNSNNSSTVLPLSEPRLPRETALLSFGRPATPPFNSTQQHAYQLPAPALHLSVGNDPAYLGHLFFSATADVGGRLTGFFSPAPLPLNRWVHIGMVLSPLEEGGGGGGGGGWGRSTQPQQGTLCGYVDGELQGRLVVDMDVLPPVPPSSEEEEEDWDRAVFVWGGIRSRGGAMLTGLIQHAQLILGTALTQAEMHEVMSAAEPWPVPSQVAGPLGLAPKRREEEEEGRSKEEQGTQWVEEAVALLHQDGGEKEEKEERKRLAHWYLSAAILLHADLERGGEGGISNHTTVHEEEEKDGERSNSSSKGTPQQTKDAPVQTQEEAAALSTSSPTAVPLPSGSMRPTHTRRRPAAASPLWQWMAGWWEGKRSLSSFFSTSSSSSSSSVSPSSSSSSSSPRFVLPGAASAHLAQLILASQALHGLDQEKEEKEKEEKAQRVIDRAFLQQYGQQVVLQQDGGGHSHPSFSSSHHDCPVALAHYLSLAGWAVDHFGEEVTHGRKEEEEGKGVGGGGSFASSSFYPSSLVIKPVEELLLRGKGKEEGDDSFLSSSSAGPPSPLHGSGGGGGGVRKDEIEYMRLRAESGHDPDALVWYAQALYWGRHGVEVNRGEAARYVMSPSAHPPTHPPTLCRL